MRVWIDQDLCTGDGLCVDHCPDVFVQLEDGIAYVAEDAIALNDPGGPGSLASVPVRRHRAVIEVAEMCPGECIFIELSVTDIREIESVVRQDVEQQRDRDDDGDEDGEDEQLAS
jgi:ferredoxin